MEDREKGEISSQKAMEILKKEGLEVTEKQAGEILLFLQKFANIAVNQCLKELNNTQ